MHDSDRPETETKDSQRKEVLRSRSSVQAPLFYKRKSSINVTPGVGEYDLDKSAESIREKSPRAPIGNAKRFEEPVKYPGVGDYDIGKSVE